MTVTEELPTKAKEQGKKVKNEPASKSKVKPAIEFAHQAERLAQYQLDQENDTTSSTQAVEAKFITAQDPVIQTADGGRLPAVPLDEALKLNRLKDEVEGRTPTDEIPVKVDTREAKDGAIRGIRPPVDQALHQSTEPEAPLPTAVPPARTNPLFPPLPMYGPPSLVRNLQYLTFRISSFIGSLCFLGIIVLGAMFTWIPVVLRNLGLRLLLKDPKKKRPFYDEELRGSEARRLASSQWQHRKSEPRSTSRRKSQDEENNSNPNNCLHSPEEEQFVPTEGGPDPLICDVSYYARRVGLDCETFKVQTEDGFIIDLWHIYNPPTTKSTPASSRSPRGPNIFDDIPPLDVVPPRGSKYPVLLIHGLLQSSGAYACTDDNSLAFFLAKSGLDVWLGNNRCGFTPTHTILHSSDPRMWAWNIRQMGVLDLPALITAVLRHTRHPKLALVAHSQGTTQTLVALAKEQRPEVGRRLSVVCLLAPAAYAGPLIGKAYFKFMRVISPGMFRLIFGIHSFIPFMMSMHRLLPGRFYGFMGYRVFSFLFDWSDARWERELRNRCFLFAPVYVSAESMRWWLGRECFATQKCILSTREEGRIEDEEDREDSDGEEAKEGSGEGTRGHNQRHHKSLEERMRFAWYDHNIPPFALWVCGSDDLVDGKRLLRRFDKGREPWVEVVHSKVIEAYEHLDVIWAVDSIEQVGKEVLETIWKTASEQARSDCKTPKGCEKVEQFKGRSRKVEHEKPSRTENLI